MADSRASSFRLALVLCAALLVTAAVAPARAQSAAPSAAEGLRLEAIAPADLFLFASFAGIDACSEAAERLRLLALWREPEVQDFVKGLKDRYEAILAQSPPEAIADLHRMRQLFSGRLSVIASGLTCIWIRDGGPPFPLPVPSVLVALDTGGKRAELERLIQGHLASDDARRWMQRQGIARTDADYKGHPLIVLTSRGSRAPQFSLAATFIGDLFVVGLNRSLLERCIDNHQGGKETLANLGAFQRARSKVEGEPLCELFLHYAAFTRRVKGLIPDEWLAALHELGLDSLNGEYYASGIRDGMSFDTYYIDMPGPRRGLLALPTPAVGDELLRLVPRTAVMAMAFRADFGPVWDRLWNAMRKLGPPRELAYVERGLARAEAGAGFKVRQDLLACLGDAWLGYAVQPRNGLVPQVVVSVDVRDRVKAEQVLSALLARARGLTVREVAYGEHKLHVIDLGHASAVSPTFAFVGDRLWVSLFSSGLKQAIGHQQDPEAESLLDAPEFKRTFAGLDRSRAEFLWYFDSPRAAAFGYSLLESLGAGAIPAESLPVDLVMLPTTEVVLEHLGGWGGIAFTDQDGTVYRDRSFSLASALAILSRLFDKAPGVVLMGIRQAGRAARPLFAVPLFGRDDNEAKFLEKSARTNKAVADAHVNLGKWSVKRKMFRAARELLGHALELVPEHEGAMKELGYRRKKVDREEMWVMDERFVLPEVDGESTPDQKENFSRYYAKLKRDSAVEYVKLAEYAANLALPAYARVSYDAAVSYDPLNEKALTGAGWVKDELGDWISPREARAPDVRGPDSVRRPMPLRVVGRRDP